MRTGRIQNRRGPNVFADHYYYRRSLTSLWDLSLRSSINPPVNVTDELKPYDVHVNHELPRLRRAKIIRTRVFLRNFWFFFKFQINGFDSFKIRHETRLFRCSPNEITNSVRTERNCNYHRRSVREHILQEPFFPIVPVPLLLSLHTKVT